jgi:hypothetical protein
MVCFYGTSQFHFVISFFFVDSPANNEDIKTKKRSSQRSAKHRTPLSAEVALSVTKKAIVAKKKENVVTKRSVKPHKSTIPLEIDTKQFVSNASCPATCAGSSTGVKKKDVIVFKRTVKRGVTPTVAELPKTDRERGKFLWNLSIPFRNFFFFVDSSANTEATKTKTRFSQRSAKHHTPQSAGVVTKKANETKRLFKPGVTPTVAVSPKTSTKHSNFLWNLSIPFLNFVFFCRATGH